ncbi:MAG: hypothetical protein HY290_03310 [Planctomycetia bacterium]|nr:hypothetical protein [Planctomycetia bacterium]
MLSAPPRRRQDGIIKGMEEIAATFCRALLIGAFLSFPAILFSKAVAGIIAWFNHRDDPRHAKRPPDIP